MDRRAWQATVHGVARVGHDFVTKTTTTWRRKRGAIQANRVVQDCAGKGGQWVQGNINKFGVSGFRMLVLLSPLNIGAFPKGEPMALIQAAATPSMKPYFYLQAISLPLKFQTHRFSAS